MADPAALLLIGSSPTVVRNAFVLATALLQKIETRELVRRARALERRVDLIYWRLARKLELHGSTKPGFEQDAVEEFRTLLAEEGTSSGTLALFDVSGSGLSHVWRDAIVAAGRRPVIVDIAAPVQATVPELARDGDCSILMAQIRWLRTHLRELAPEGRSDGFIWTDRAVPDASRLKQILQENGLDADAVDVEALPAPPFDGLPRVNLHQLGLTMRSWSCPSLLKQVQLLLKNGGSDKAAASAVFGQAREQLQQWESVATESRRERGLLRPLYYGGSAPRSAGCKPPFFILGAPRSGTTILRDLLRQHPSLIAPEETFFFRSGESFGSPAYRNFHQRNSIIRTHRTLDGVSDAQFDEVLESAVDRRDLMDGYLQKFGEAKGRPQAQKFDKTPQNVFGLPLIAALYPDALVVHIHRHPVEVVASARAGRMIGEHNLIGALNVWLEPMLIIEQCQSMLDDRLIEVSLDELKRSQRPTMQWLTERLGLPAHDYDLQVLRENAVSPVVKSALTPEDIEFVEQRAQHFMQKYGYGPYLSRMGDWPKAEDEPAETSDPQAELPAAE